MFPNEATQVVEMDEDHTEWLTEVFQKHGLVGMVKAKGFNPSYFELIEMLEDAGVRHGLDGVSGEGLGQHIEEIFDMACKDFTSVEIASALGVKTKTLSRYCARHGIALAPAPTVADFDTDIRAMSETMTVPEIASELGFSATAIRLYCKTNGVTPKRGKPGYYHQNGYKLVHVAGHPAAGTKGYVREHRLVAEKTLGRVLTSDEVVHHKNGDKTDNRPDNLDVMTLADHSRLHTTNGDCGWAAYHDTGRKKI